MALAADHTIASALLRLVQGGIAQLVQGIERDALARDDRNQTDAHCIRERYPINGGVQHGPAKPLSHFPTRFLIRPVQQHSEFFAAEPSEQVPVAKLALNSAGKSRSTLSPVSWP